MTVPSEVLAAAEADVATGRATSVSAWVADAMATKAGAESLAEVLADIAEASGGPLSKDELAWARERLAR
ncbi:hypothetical protein BH23ACT2_BH23ACT2_06650 [soil metagenome]